jgi:hypothetical protein
VTHSVDYAQGFEEGYYDVASGGDGCPPPLPPEKYWRATYNSPVGQEHVKAWFQGFRDGAAAARADGVAAYGTIYVPEEHRNANRNRTPNGPPPNENQLQPLPQGGLNQAPIIGPQPNLMLPPNPMPSAPIPMSDAHKAPPLKDVQPPPMPMPPPSAKRQDSKGPNQPIIAATPVTPAVASPSAPPSPAAVQVSATVESKSNASGAEPVQLKLPEFELPAGFTPEAALGEPKAIGVPRSNP